MAFILKWEQGPLVTLEAGLLLELIDTVPAPDTVLSDFDVEELVKIFSEFQSYESAELTLYEWTVFLSERWGPLAASLLDTVPAPDTIFQEFSAFEKTEIPFWPASTEVNPGTTLFVGDVFSYMG